MPPNPERVTRQTPAKRVAPPSTRTTSDESMRSEDSDLGAAGLSKRRRLETRGAGATSHQPASTLSTAPQASAQQPASALPATPQSTELSHDDIPPDHTCFVCRKRGGNYAFTCIFKNGSNVCTRCVKEKQRCRPATTKEKNELNARCPQCKGKGYTKCVFPNGKAWEKTDGTNAQRSCTVCIKRNKTCGAAIKRKEISATHTFRMDASPSTSNNGNSASTPATASSRSRSNNGNSASAPARTTSSRLMPNNGNSASTPARTTSSHPMSNNVNSASTPTTTISASRRRSTRNINNDTRVSYLDYEALSDDDIELSNVPPKSKSNSTKKSHKIPGVMRQSKLKFQNKHFPTPEDSSEETLLRMEPMRGSSLRSMRGSSDDMKAHQQLMSEAYEAATISSMAMDLATESQNPEYTVVRSVEQVDGMDLDNNNDVDTSSGPQRLSTRSRRATANYGPTLTPQSDFLAQDSEDDISLYEEGSHGDEPEYDSAEEEVAEDECHSDEDNEPDDVSMDEVIPFKPPARKTPAKPKSERQGKGIDYSLPPMHENVKIFEDMVSKAVTMGFADALEELNRPINVATMCSGTESPLFGLLASAQALKEKGLPALEFRHLFSAEIEQFKQAFIERNFAPEILFRDIREFTAEDAVKATTAYGALRKIPGNVDILVAGFSCKNLSAQNNFQKSLKEDGESGETWRGVYKYSDRFRPRVVLLENVKSKKEVWNGLVGEWAHIGYEARWLYCDTKDYYYPQTRERMYMIAVDRRAAGSEAPRAVEQWKSTMQQLQRRCSSPYEAFLANFPRSVMKYSALISESSWELSGLRYDQIRSEMGLGNKRPCTQWSEDGTKQPFDFADHEWFESRSSREWEAIEVAYLRAAVLDGTDPAFKETIWDVSQNADRYHDKPGVVPCITPKGQVFATNRQGPLTGLELLGLQGLPLDKILLARESAADCQDLAGNAMSTTVIAASLISAITCAYKTFAKLRLGKQIRPFQQAPSKVQHSLLGNMVAYETTNSDPQELNLNLLSKTARSSSRLCSRECDDDFCEAPVRCCSLCGHTACASHAGNPKHVYPEMLEDIPRSPAAPDFVLEWKSKLPPCVIFENFSGFSLSETYQAQLVSNSLTKAFANRLARANPEGVYFHRADFKRQFGSWKVLYKSPYADLVLSLGQKLEWQLYVHCAPELPGSSDLRKIFEGPIARGHISESLLAPEWEIFIPHVHDIPLNIQGSRDTHKSFRNKLGLVGYETETVPALLSVQHTAEEAKNPNLLSESLAGDYAHLPRCGTASNSLYKRTTAPSLYLFLDPDPLSHGSDSFHFSYDCSRKQPGDHRETLALLDPNWRPWNEEDTQDCFISAISHGSWERVAQDTMILKPYTPSIGAKMLSSPLGSPGTGCTEIASILKITAPNTVFAADISDNLWALEQLVSMPSFPEWQLTDLNFDIGCACTPPNPRLLWNVQPNGIATAYEDPQEAAVYERAIKSHTTVFHIEPSNKGKGINIGLNISLLVHRAASAFIHTDRAHRSKPEKVSWRLLTNQNYSTVEKLPKFKLRSNANDKKFSGQLELTHPLHGAQPRALEWMRLQERGVKFTLAETEEAFDSKLGWRLEVMAESDTLIRGGVLADRPSFGKTVTTIALIQSEFEDSRFIEDRVEESCPSVPTAGNLFDVGATLIICPPHIVEQWQEEFSKFLKEDVYREYNMILIKTFADLKDLQVYDVEQSKVVIVSWTVLAEDEYIAHLASFVGMPEPATATSAKGVPNARAFAAWMDRVAELIPEQISVLEELGSIQFSKHTNEVLEERLEEKEFRMTLPLQLRHGSQYQSFSSEKATNKKGKKPVRHDKKPKDPLLPLLHLFRFNRVVVDEYHYLNVGQKDNKKAQGNLLSSVGIKALAAHKRWILSGTPALGSFADVDNIASFLGIRLGRYSDDGPVAKRTQINRLQIEAQTSVEKFLSSKNCMSPQWNQARHQRAQDFLDTFVRQNEPSLKHIKCSEFLKTTELGFVHHAVYLELSQYLISQRMAMRRQKNQDNERAKQVNASLNGAKSGEEALQRCAMSFETEDGQSGLQSLLQTRTEEHEDIAAKLMGLFCNLENYRRKKGKGAQKVAGEAMSASMIYDHFKHDVRREGWLGDTDATAEIGSLLDYARSNPGKGISKDRKLDNEVEAKKILSQVRKHAKDLMKVIRAQRFICNIRDVLQEKRNTCDAPACQGYAGPSSLTITPNCGHLCCLTCLENRSSDHETCSVPTCNAAVSAASFIKFTHIGSHQEPSSGYGFGSKMDAVADLVLNIPDQNQVLLFAPDADAVYKMKQVLNHHIIPCITPSANDPSKALHRFKNEVTGQPTIKVLILDLSSETAAGVNLHNANHIIFVAPLLVKTQYEYNAAMEQAIARSRRYGQQKVVHIYHFAALRTVDVDIIEQRHKRRYAITEMDRPMRLPGSDWSSLSESAKTKLVSNDRDEKALVPAVWLEEPTMREALGVGDVPESYTSLINFSESFEDEEE